MTYLTEKHYRHLLIKLSNESKKFITKQKISCKLLTISKCKNDGIYTRVVHTETLGFVKK